MDSLGLRPLHYAAGGLLPYFDDRDDLVESRIRIVELFLENGACVSDTNQLGFTALDYAVRLGRESIMQCLKQKQEEVR